MNETELEMKERLQQLFITLSEVSKDCEAHLLPSITKAMLELYSIFRTKQVQSQPFDKGLSLAEQAFLLAALNVKLSNVDALRGERSR